MAAAAVEALAAVDAGGAAATAAVGATLFALGTVGSALDVTAETLALETGDASGGWAGAVDVAIVSWDKVEVGAPDAFRGVGANSLSSGKSLSGGLDSLVTVGNTACTAGARFGGGSIDFAIGSESFLGAEILMSATTSFRTRANP